jgi:sortase A
MLRRTGVLVVLLALFTAACSGGDTTHRVATVSPKKATTSSSSSTTTTTAAAPVTRSAAPHIQRVRTLPAGERPTRAPKAAAYRGPTPTGRIQIPRIGLDHLTYEGIDLATIDYGPSHWPGTALPGQVGNTVFPGHRVTHSHPFLNIDLVQVGDPVVFVNSSGRYTYEVTQTFVVDADETWIADPTDTPTMTIFGCHPKHSAKQRYVVKGKLVKSERISDPSQPAAATPGNDNSGGEYTTAPDPSAPPETTTTTTPPKKGLGGLLGG